MNLNNQITINFGTLELWILYRIEIVKTKSYSLLVWISNDFDSLVSLYNLKLSIDFLYLDNHKIILMRIGSYSFSNTKIFLNWIPSYMLTILILNY
jgi:hypothetical protein